MLYLTTPPGDIHPYLIHFQGASSNIHSNDEMLGHRWRLWEAGGGMYIVHRAPGSILWIIIIAIVMIVVVMDLIAIVMLVTMMNLRQLQCR